MMKRTALLALLAVAVMGASANGTQGADTKASAAGPGGGGASEGRKLFSGGTTPSCATCHALRDAGAAGNIGPDLDELKPDAGRVRNAVQKGFENMPAFGHVLSDGQIDAISRYVEQAAGK
jgi:mono/diheme cytochrome c family protein